MCEHVCECDICGMWCMCTGCLPIQAPVKLEVDTMCPTTFFLNPLKTSSPSESGSRLGTNGAIVSALPPQHPHQPFDFQMCGVMPSFLTGHYYQLSHLLVLTFILCVLCVCCVYVCGAHKGMLVHTPMSLLR